MFMILFDKVSSIHHFYNRIRCSSNYKVRCSDIYGHTWPAYAVIDTRMYTCIVSERVPDTRTIILPHTVSVGHTYSSTSAPIVVYVSGNVLLLYVVENGRDGKFQGNGLCLLAVANVRVIKRPFLTGCIHCNRISSVAASGNGGSFGALFIAVTRFLVASFTEFFQSEFPSAAFSAQAPANLFVRSYT